MRRTDRPARGGGGSLRNGTTVLRAAGALVRAVAPGGTAMAAGGVHWEESALLLAAHASNCSSRRAVSGAPPSSVFGSISDEIDEPAATEDVWLLEARRTLALISARAISRPLELRPALISALAQRTNWSSSAEMSAVAGGSSSANGASS
jgi:hypothetical protein